MSEDKLKNPIQPLGDDGQGVIRFKANAIVQHLLKFATERGCSLNEIACMNFSNDDHQQLAQLIGYSLSGYGELSYVDDDAYNAAALMAKGKDERDARIESLQEMVDDVRNGLREPIAALFGVHPENLTRG